MFKYDSEVGLVVRGQVFTPAGHQNDALLSSMDFVRPVEKGTPVVQCAECGSLFLDDAARERHGRHFHDHWCDCGWSPPDGTVDKDEAMKSHMRTCDVWKSERQAATQQRIKQATAKPVPVMA